MATRRLEREDWTRAGLAALERDGVEAVAVVPLARELGVTRGSFYWHFASRDELLRRVLERWEREHSTDVLRGRRRDRATRARGSRRSSSAPSSSPRRTSPACSTPPTASRSSPRRCSASPPTGWPCSRDAYRECGSTPAQARRQALLAYAAYVGLARLPQDGTGALSPRERRALAAHVTATFVP